MTRRFVQINGELVEVTPGYQRAPVNHDAVLWNDRAYQDMNDPRFTSRKQHREYMKRNGLTTIDDFRQHDQQQAKKREDFYRGVDPTRREDIARALEKRK
jgi:hypothetical protein